MRTRWDELALFGLILALVAVLLTGCAPLVDALMDPAVYGVWDSYWANKEEAKEEKPPSPSTPPYYTPELYIDEPNTIYKPGISLCTRSYAPDGKPDKRSGSIAIGHIVFWRWEDGRTIKRCWSELTKECPLGTWNWYDDDDENNCTHLYTTRAQENVAGADGTRRGRIYCYFDEPGTWNITIFARNTTNRAKDARLAIVTYDRVRWYRWNQQGAGEWNPVPVAEGVRFKESWE